MKINAIILAFGLCVGSASAQQVERGRLQKTEFRSVKEKPETTIHVAPSDAAAFWKRLVPADITDNPAELDEFMRTHAHKFWEPYVDKRITVSGAHYCTCCFNAAIGVSGLGYSEGWTVRLDDFIAIGFPEGSTAYTENGEEVLLKGSLRPVHPIVQAVGIVAGPVTIIEDLGISQAIAYYILMQ